MSDDYRPLDISGVANADLPEIGGRAPATGEQTLRGLPFQIGGRCVLLQQGDSPITLPIGGMARHVIVAHTLLESKLREGDWLGNTIATYRFNYEDGGEAAVLIRERFEIGIVPCPWGNLAFLAYPDLQDSLIDRYQGQ